jgi:2-oxoglutarate ferredoxin oxidoreductase subunit gamma
VNEIRISGFGGQGVIRCGYIIGKTAALFDNKHATLTQSFGPEARGSACSAQIIVDDDPVRYPYLTRPDTVVAMSQEAYDKYGADITSDGTLMIDDDLVKPEDVPAGCRVYAVPATRIAEELGNRIAANIVMLGFFTAITDIISVEAARRALPSSVPSRFLELNEKAFEEGYNFGSDLMGREPIPAPAALPDTGEYRPSKVTKAKAGRRVTTLARVNLMDGKERESEEARKAWKKADKKGKKLKAAEKKALEKKMSGGKRATGKKAATRKAARKTTTKKATSKAKARKTAPKRPAKKTTPKTTSKRTAPKRSTKRTTPKKTGKRAAPKRPTPRKKSSPPAKKAAKTTTTKRKSTRKK